MAVLAGVFCVAQGADGMVFHHFAVDAQHLVFVFDQIAGHADGAFDVIDFGVFRIVEHHHIATPHFAGGHQHIIENRHTDAV